jgi:hypothetical protein
MTIRTLCIPVFILLSSIQLHAQTKDTLADFKQRGTLWGLTFGDFAFKGNADTVGDGLGRGNNQYSKMPANSKFFQFRRVYLGYNYDISPKLSAELLFAAEDDFYPGSVGNQSATGDVLGDNKFAPYLKLANIRWKNFFKGTDLVMGEMATPAFPLLSEVVWGYRSVERTVADMQRTPSVDQGISLQGHFGEQANFGYNLMAGNGNGAKPENDMFPWFYGDIWAKFLDKRIIVDLYQDYTKINWTTATDTNTDIYHHDRRMTKLFVAYTVPKFTVGVEAFTNTLMGDVTAYAVVNGVNKTYYRTTVATAYSIYARGRIYKDILGFFARYDNYDPGHKISEVTSIPRIISYNLAPTSTYDPTTREQLVTFGVDYTPFPNLHLMPNFYMNTYQCTLPSQYYYLNPKASGVLGTDAVYRLTVYYIFGKKDAVRY